jgi:hypothetical protein
MKATAMAMLVLVAGAGAQADENVEHPERTVTACMAVFDSATYAARRQAVEMFASIGVNLEWRHKSGDCPPGAIVINVIGRTPLTLHPHALAYAQPYDGTHICVFYDRIAADRDSLTATRVLAHVLVHEITHILEGISRHSDQGVMKAQWGPSDFCEMRRKPLAFAPEDVLLIELGMTARAAAHNVPHNVLYSSSR